MLRTKRSSDRGRSKVFTMAVTAVATSRVCMLPFRGCLDFANSSDHAAGAAGAIFSIGRV
jgi:hypothetical protein